MGSLGQMASTLGDGLTPYFIDSRAHASLPLTAQAASHPSYSK
jgi:hypothetical protein